MTHRIHRTTAAILLVALAATPFAPAGNVKPSEGDVFRFGGTKYANCTVEFRDPKGKLWPGVYVARARGGEEGEVGSLTVGKRPEAELAIVTERMSLTWGFQGFRIIGETVEERTYTDRRGRQRTRRRAPETRFEVVKLDAPTQRTGKDAKGRERTVRYMPFEGKLTFGDKTLAVSGRCHTNYRGKKGTIRSVHLRFECVVKGEDLGLVEKAENDVLIVVHAGGRKM